MILIILGLVYACGNNGSEKKDSSESTDSQSKVVKPPEYDSVRGAGKFTHVELAEKLDHQLADGGKTIYGLKCASCHKLTGEKLIGPGWKDVTQRRKPEWTMNFITNTREMLIKDPKAQSMLEICMVEMPNQNLTDDDARKVFEFMRQNDGLK